MFASLLLAAALSAPAPLTNVTIDAVIDPPTRAITATETIRLGEGIEKSVDLDLRLATDEKALMNVDSVSVDGVAAGPNVIDNGETLRVAIPHPGSTLTIKYRAELLESSMKAYGYYVAESAAPGTHWYPLPKGTRFANFDVTVTHPPAWTILTSGIATESTAGRERSHAEHVEGFAVVTGENFKRQEIEQNGIKAVAFSSPAQLDTFLRIARRALEAASWYKSTYGFFPVRQIGIVPGYRGASGGWPLPNIFMVHQQVLDDEFITAITAHELGHYYWGLYVLGSDERLSWVMLANGIWIDQKYLATRKNIPLLEQWRDTSPTPGGFLNFLVGYTTAIAAGYDQRLGISKADERTLPYNYNSYVRHGKGAAGVMLEASRLGDDKFIAFQRELLQSYASKPLDAETFAARLEEAGVPGARDFFASWVGPGRIDYSVADVTTSAKETTVTVTRQGTIPFPIVVELTDGAGRRSRETIDGKEQMTKVVFPTNSVQRVALDPDGWIPMWSSTNPGMRRAFLKGAFGARLDDMFRSLAASYLPEHPEANDIRYLVAVSMMRHGEFDAAAEATRIPAIHTVDECRLECLQARVLVRRGDSDAAKKAFELAESSPVCSAVPSELARTRQEIEPAQ